MNNEDQKIEQVAYLERPFVYIKPSSKDILRYWYQARAFVLNLLIETLRPFQDADSFPKSWHFVVNGDSDFMLSVVRHLALYAHFISYEEYDRYGHLTCKNRTVISIVSGAESTAIKDKLERPDFLGNLPKHCPITIFGEPKNEDSYIDIAIDIIKDLNEVHVADGYKRIDISEHEVLEKLKSIDPDVIKYVHTLKAICAGKAYDLGNTVNNLPYEDINSARRYFNALNTFQNKILDSEKSEILVKKEWVCDINAVRSGISNILCADCFEIREIEIKHKAKKDKIRELLAWQKYMKELSHCEHNRWVVEKLILGYEQLSSEEIFKYEHFFGDDRAAYLKSLKKDDKSPKHIDICSNRDLRRIDPDNMKYDSFLMLAIPFILDYVRMRK